MERAVVDRAIAEKGDGHLIRFAELETVSGSGGLQDRRGRQCRWCPSFPFPARTDAWSRRAPASIRLPRPNSSAKSSSGGMPLARACPWPRWVLKTASSVRRWAQTPVGDRLLAYIGVACAVNEAARVAAGELLFARADELHGAVLKLGFGLHCDRGGFVAFQPRTESP